MPRKPSDRAIAEALRATLGKVCLAAERLGCPQALIYRRARASPRVAEVIRFFRGKLLDAAESSLWKGVLDGETWAVRLAFDLWGRWRDFGDGSEIWHSPAAFDEAFPPQLFQSLVKRLLDDEVLLDYRRTRELGAEPGDLRRADQPRALEDGAAPGPYRPGDRRHDPGEDGADPGN
jgi:hypothetical protein